MANSRKSRFKLFALQFVVNKAAFFLTDIGFAAGIIPDAETLLKAQAIMLLFIPVSLYFGPLAIQGRAWKAGFGGLCLAAMGASLAWGLHAGDTEMYLPLSVAMVVFLLCQNILLRFRSTALQLGLSTLHMAIQATVFLVWEPPVSLMISYGVGLGFALVSLVLLMGASSQDRWAPPFSRNWFIGLGLNGTRSALNFGIRILVITSPYPWLLVLHRASNQLVSVVFTAVIGQGVELPETSRRQRYLAYGALQVLGLAAAIWFSAWLFILFTLVISLAVELAQAEGKYLAATKSAKPVGPV